MKKYRCVEWLEVESVDTDDEILTISVGTVWEHDPDRHFDMGIEEVHLENEEGFWVELSENELARYFKELKL